MSSITELLNNIAQLPVIKSPVPDETVERIIRMFASSVKRYPVEIWVDKLDQADVNVLKSEYNIHVAFDQIDLAWTAILSMDETPEDNDLKIELNKIRKASSIAFLTDIYENITKRSDLNLQNFKDGFAFGYIDLLRRLHDAGLKCEFNLENVDYQSTYCIDGLHLTKIL